MTDWSTNRLTDWLTDWLTHWLTDSLTDRATDRQTGWLLADWQTNRWTDKWVDGLTDWPTQLTSSDLLADSVVYTLHELFLINRLLIVLRIWQTWKINNNRQVYSKWASVSSSPCQSFLFQWPLRRGNHWVLPWKKVILTRLKRQKYILCCNMLKFYQLLTFNMQY